MNRKEVQCSEFKTCKKRVCSCHHKHSLKTSCGDGCDDNKDAECLPVKKRKSEKYNRTIKEKI